MDFAKELYKRIWILDGAYGTRFQSLGLEEPSYRGRLLKDHPQPLKGNYDLLNLSAPDEVRKIHDSYIAAGARIIKTNTFNSNVISQTEYKTAHLSSQMALQGARIARAAADAVPDGVFVAGDIGPTSKTLSLSPDAMRPGYRAISFKVLEEAYFEEMSALKEGGVDLFLVETIFDTLNAKAAIHAWKRLTDKSERLPLWLSLTISDKSGRTLSGQTLEAFWSSIEHAGADVVGLNCALGPQAMLPYLRNLGRLATCAIGCHPNAGLPNPLGGYDESPQTMAAVAKQMAQEGLINIVGGCCGTTPEHIAAIAKAVEGLAPRNPPRTQRGLHLSGLEDLFLPSQGAAFAFVGERTNVSGSPVFATAARKNDLDACLKVALEQIRGGANILDISFDEAMLDSPDLMGRFLNLLASEPEIARVPLMLDSSSLQTIESGLQATQGKCVVNSISLKDGPAKFLAAANLIRQYGAAAIVMAFDEQGQAVSVDRKIQICRRAYELMTQAGFPSQDIIFDPNVLAIGTGMSEHSRYAIEFLESLPKIKEACPGTRLSGGISNLSFAFRGQRAVREALNAVFLSHAIAAGLDMGIVNAGLLRPVESVDPMLRELCEDLIFNRRADATERMLEYSSSALYDATTVKQRAQWRELPLDKKLIYALENGIDDYVDADAQEALKAYPTPLQIVEGPLMDGMRRVGDLFGEGKMFLPQVVKTARVMKLFVEALRPYMEKESVHKQGRVLMATVKGDVHDIGKNIVGIVLECNGYEVIDLGVMVPFEKILSAIKELRPDIVGFSGLITPSLGEMAWNARQMQKEGLKLPILIGGAATSKLHTAVKIDTEYSGPIAHVIDASRVAEVCHKLLSPDERDTYARELKSSYAKLREEFSQKPPAKACEITDSRGRSLRMDASPRPVPRKGPVLLSPQLRSLIEFIDYSPLFWAWGLKGVYPQILENPEAAKLFADSQKMLSIMDGKVSPHGVMGFWTAWREGDDVHIISEAGEELGGFHFLRQQRPEETQVGQPCLCLADFVSPRKGEDSLGGFVVSATDSVDRLAAQFHEKGDDYSALLARAVGDRIVEAFAEYAHLQARRLWGLNASSDNIADLISGKYQGIRPAIGYPSIPDHSEKALLWRLLDAETSTGARLTENYAMSPASTVCGLYFHHPQARYFNIGKIGEDQLSDYAARKGWTIEEAKKWLAAVL